MQPSDDHLPFTPSRGSWPVVVVAMMTALLVPPVSAEWELQSPIPTYLQVGGLAAVTADRVFLATQDDPFDDAGALFRSDDGGLTWTHLEIPASLGDPLHGVFFLDGLNGWTWGNRNYRTTDGGLTWTEMPVLGSAYSMHFFTVDLGVTQGNFGTYLSRDGGVSWNPAPNDIHSVDTLDGNLVLGTGPDGIYRSTDGGAGFALVYEPEDGGETRDVTFASATAAIAVIDDVLHYSTDAGLTWTAGSDAEGRFRLTRLGEGVVLAWGASGIFPALDDRVFRTADGGRTWTDLGDVTPAFSTAVTVVSPSLAFFVDQGGSLSRSVDQGATWTRVFLSPGPHLGFSTGAEPSFVDEQIGYFAFGNGFVIKTTDGGLTWEQVSSGGGATVDALARFASGHMIAAGSGGNLWTSDDGNAPWIVRRIPAARGDLVSVVALEGQGAIALDEDGTVYRSADRGITWTAGSPVPYRLDGRDLSFENDLEGWVAGGGFAGASLFHTLDGGESWRAIEAFQGLYVAVDAEEDLVFAAGYGGWSQRSDDGGVTWTEGEFPGHSVVIHDMDFWNAQVGYAVGENGYAVRSADGGLTWEVLPTPSDDQRLTALHLAGPNKLWIAVGGGGFLYSEDGGIGWSWVPVGLSAGSGSYGTLVASPMEEVWLGGWQGTILRFAEDVPPPLNHPPQAAFDFAASGLSVAFTDKSTDLDGDVVAWEWSFGDGGTSSEQHPSHVFAAADTYHVHLTVTDDDGATHTTLRFVVVQPNPGGTFGDFTEVTPLDPLFVTPQDEDFWVISAAPADYDSDGDLDIAVLGFYVWYGDRVENRFVLLRNNGPGPSGAWDFSYVEMPFDDPLGATDMAWGDVDGDGDEDLAVGNQGSTRLYRNDEGTLVETNTELPGYDEDNDQADFDLRSISWADYDNDGDLDLLLPSVWDAETFTYSTRLMRNDGPNGSGGWTFTDAEAGLAATRHAQSLWADDDGDQDLDLLLVHLAPLTDDGFIRRYRNDGNGVFVGEDLLGGLRVEHGEVQWGDADDDGDLDLLVIGHIREADGSFDRVLRLYRNDGGTYVPTEVLDCPGCEGWYDLVAAGWADHDSDGDLDILLAGTYHSGTQIEGRAKIYDNDGSGTFGDSGNQLPAPRSSGTRGGAFRWLDLDGDHDLDYFIAGSYWVPGGNNAVEAQMHLYLNDAGGQNAAPSATPQLAAQAFDDGSVVLKWNPASDDLTPADALTYDLRLYRQSAPEAPRSRIPEPGSVRSVRQWTFSGLPEGVYAWTVQAVDSAYNVGPRSEGTFTIGDGDPALIFEDDFETGAFAVDWIPFSP